MEDGLAYGPDPLRVDLPSDEEEEDIEVDEEDDEFDEMAAQQQMLAKVLSTLPRYNGEGAWNVHQGALEQWRELNGIQAGDGAVAAAWKKTALLYSLTGKAAERASTIGIGTEAYNQADNWAEMMELLKNIFAPVADSEISRVAFRARKQGPREDIVSYLTAKISLWHQAYPQAGQRTFHTIMDEGINGMANNVIKRLVRRSAPNNQQQLVDAATAAVASERYSYAAGYSESTTLDGLMTIVETNVGRNFGNNELGEPMEVDAVERETRKCFNCNKTGHLSKNCWKPKKKKEDKDKKKKPQQKGGCYNCGDMGHFARACPKPKKKKPEVNQVDDDEAPDVYEKDD